MQAYQCNLVQPIAVKFGSGCHWCIKYLFLHIFGKINYYWEDKNLDRIVNIFLGIEQNHKLIFVGQGKGFDNFSRYIP
jgi:hypothetical protein